MITLGWKFPLYHMLSSTCLYLAAISAVVSQKFVEEKIHVNEESLLSLDQSLCQPMKN